MPRTVTEEGRAHQALGDDVGAVVRRWDLGEVDGAARETPPDHGVACAHPAGGLLEAFATSAVDNGLGVGVQRGGERRSNPHVEVVRERAQRHDVLVRQGGHPELGRSGAVVTGGGGDALPGKGATAVADDDEAPVTAALGRVAVRRVDERAVEVEARLVAKRLEDEGEAEVGGTDEVAPDTQQEAEHAFVHPAHVDVRREDAVGEVRVGADRVDDKANGPRDLLCVRHEGRLERRLGHRWAVEQREPVRRERGVGDRVGLAVRREVLLERGQQVVEAAEDRPACDLRGVRAGDAVAQAREVLAELGGLRRRVELGRPSEVEVCGPPPRCT